MRRTRNPPLPTLTLAIAALSIVGALAAGPPALAAAAPAPPLGMKEGMAALQADDLPGAAKAFQAVVDREPGNAEAWFRLGVVERQLGRYDAALRSVGTALEKGYSPALANTSLALVYLAKKDLDRTFEHLDRAVKAGLPTSVLETHPGLAPIRDDPRFKTLVAAAEKASHPCEGDPRYRAFDFWVGDWDVYSGGQLAGTNHIDRVARGCALLENWTGAGGVGGKSLNYFDPADGKWRQSWVGDGGEIILYAGEWKDGAIRMTGETRLPNGTRLPSRGTWTPRPDGAVRQLLEASPDGGKTWNTAFDGVYVKKGSGPPAAR